MKTIAVIGAGTMGNGIAHVFAQNGFTTTIVDISDVALDKALATIAKNLDRQVAKGSITEEIKAATLNNLTKSTSIAEGVKNTTLLFSDV